MSKRTHQPCQRPAMQGRAVCYHHGGKTPTGIASAAWQHGRYSKYLPQRLLARYHTAADDPTLLELHQEIALLDARLADVLGRVETGESGALWGQLAGAWDDLLTAQTAGDSKAAGTALGSIGRLIARGHADYAAWGEVQRLIQQRKALVESERKHRVEEQQMVSVTQAMLLVAVLGDAVKRHVSDPGVLAAIQQDITRFIGGTAGRVVDSVVTPAGE